MESGGALPAELFKAQTILETDSIEIEKLKREKISATQTLASFWNGNSDDISISPERNIFNVSDHKIIENSLNDSLQLKLSGLQIQAAEKNLSLEKSKSVQDVTLSAGYQRLNGFNDDTLLAAVSIPLPFADKNQGGIANASKLSQSSKLKNSHERIRLNARFNNLVSSLRALDFESKQLKETVIPQAQKTLAALQNAFALGRASLLEVIDSQRTLINLRSRSLEVLRSKFENEIEIEVLSADAPSIPNR